MSSLQLFIQDASGAAAEAANTPGHDFGGMLLVLWFYITSLCAGAVNYLATGIHRLSEWIQQPGELLQNICPTLPCRSDGPTNNLESRPFASSGFLFFG